MRKEVGREGGKRSQKVSDRGDWGLSFNFAVVSDFNLFPVPPSEAQFTDNVLMNRQNVANRSMVFFSFITLIAYSIEAPNHLALVGDAVNRTKSAK
jgi:hypothetical protein